MIRIEAGTKKNIMIIFAQLVFINQNILLRYFLPIVLFD